jgi:hypothetical protein
MRAFFTIFAFCISLFTLPRPVLADDAQHWEVLSITAGTHDGWRFSGENIARTSQSRGFYELEQNLMVGHMLDFAGVKGVTVWLGYTHDPLYSHADFSAMEHRFRQQVSVDRLAKVGPVTLSGRLRIEERWREGQAGTGWRLRPFVKGTLPVGGHFALVASHESFLSLSSTTFQRPPGEERMRNFAGMDLRVTRHVLLELGYLNQHGFVSGGADTSDNIASLEIRAGF